MIQTTCERCSSVFEVDDDRLVGLVGLIIDEGYFTQTLLPKAIDMSLPKFGPKLSDGEDEELWVVVRDGLEKQVLPTCLNA